MTSIYAPYAHPIRMHGGRIDNTKCAQKLKSGSSSRDFDQKGQSNSRQWRYERLHGTFLCRSHSTPSTRRRNLPKLLPVWAVCALNPGCEAQSRLLFLFFFVVDVPMDLGPRWYLGCGFDWFRRRGGYDGLLALERLPPRPGVLLDVVVNRPVPCILRCPDR